MGSDLGRVVSSIFSTLDRCTDVRVVTLHNLNGFFEILPRSECCRVAVVKSENAESVENGAKTGEFCKDLVASYLHKTQLKTDYKRKGKSAGDFRKGNKYTDQTRISTHTNCADTVQHAIHTTNIQPNTSFPERELFISQHSQGGSSLVKRCSDLRQNLKQRGVEDLGDSFSQYVPGISSSRGLITCPTQVYTFRKGLVPSKEAHDQDSFYIQQALPPVIADRVGRTFEQKRYRLMLERDIKRQTDFSSRRYPSDYTSVSSKDSGLEAEESVVPKLVPSKIFSAEKVIPVAHTWRNFDFKGYVEFLCQEKGRKTAAKHSNVLNSFYPEEYELQSIPSDSWLKDNFDSLLVSVCT